MLKPFATILAFTLPALANAQEQKAPVISVRPAPPAISFDVHIANSEGVVPILIPSPRPTRVNAEGISVVVIEGVEAYHITGLAEQAAGTPNADISMKPVHQPLLPSQLTALNWLAKHPIDLGNQAVTWHYTFNYQFNNQYLKAGWASSFAQADVIKALMLANKVTGEGHYIDLAKQAAYAYEIPCEKGGLRCDVGGIPWFAELPLGFGYAPMILNGHLYSVVMLHRLWELTGDPRIKAAYDEGLASARKILLRFDTGYWTTYQLRPRTVNVMFAMEPSSGVPTELREVRIASRFSEPSSVVFGLQERKTFPSSAVWGSLGNVTSTGRTATGLIFAQIPPGRLVVDHDPVNFDGFDLTIRYSAPDCASLKVAGLDWRGGSRNWIGVSDLRTAKDGDVCVASTKLDANNNQWSQVSDFYHDWHMRLAAELWKASQDPFFYVTALRWRRYVDIFKQQQAGLAESRIRPAPAMPTDDVEAARAVLEALDGKDPASVTSDEVLRQVETWIAEHAVSPSKAQSMLTLIGAKSVPATAD